MGCMAHFEFSSVIEAPQDEVFKFITEPVNLQKIMPADYHVTSTAPIPPMKKGAEYEIRISRYGVSVAWGILIEEMTPGEMFRDRQTSGPFSVWVHTHSLEGHGQGTLMKDIIEYDVAFGLFGKLAQDLYIKRELQRIFAHRHQKTQELIKR